MTTVAMLTSQMEYPTLQVDALEMQIGTANLTVLLPTLWRLQDEFRDLASSLKIALQVKVGL
jgi:hypothetical protein